MTRRQRRFLRITALLWVGLCVGGMLIGVFA